jgi:hypothetical protein
VTEAEQTRELARTIIDAEIRLEAVVTREVARLEGQLQGHREDRFAHGPAREAGMAQMQEWQRWRASVDRWRWMMAGSVALFGLESTAVGIAVSLYGLFGHG